ncbi:MAG: ABC transporter ATP-binding protein [Lentisphaeria bacterium]|nr:ABC transporter ATP-binding protein [Lentisphaeria bacterium]
MEATGSEPTVVVKAVGLTKVFKDFWNRPKARAVNGIDFTVKRGQVFGLLGPNGSGKSTTVKMILGLLYATRGTLEVFGETPDKVEIKRRIGYLPEETYLYKYLTARETLEFFGALFGLSTEECRNRTTQLLEMVGLANSYNRPVGEFSKGMARRIGLAQALVNDPDLVILDEPTSGLDPIGCREVKDVIRLLAARGKTVILCSHLLADVQDVCDEVVVLYGGKIRTEGSLEEILTVGDKTRITMPRLDEQAMEEIRQVLRKHTGSDEFSVDHPTMDLEEFFLDVVRKAREAHTETAGVQAGGEIAPYLRGADEEDSDTTRKDMLNALTATAQEERLDTSSDGGAEESPSVAVDEAKLAELAGAGTPDTAAEPPPPEESGQKEAQTQEASQRLENLLGDSSSKK